MTSSKYTFDRIEGEYCVFLKRPDETEQLIIPTLQCSKELKEGDIVTIHQQEDNYIIQSLTEETLQKKQDIHRFMQNLRQRKRS